MSAKPKTPAPTLSLRDASARSAIHAAVLHRDASNGKLPAQKIDGHWRVRTDDLDAYSARWHATSHRVAAGIKHAHPSSAATPVPPRVSRSPPRREQSSSFGSHRGPSSETGAPGMRHAIPNYYIEDAEPADLVTMFAEVAAEAQWGEE